MCSIGSEVHQGLIHRWGVYLFSTISKQIFFAKKSFFQISACFPALPPDSDIENIITLLLSSFKGAVSSIYSNIHGLRSDSLEAHRTTWETSLGILENMWAEALCRVHKSICAKDCFIQCKVLHHGH